MHETAYEHGSQFFEVYWNPRFVDVLELGSQDVNGSLRDHAPSGAAYVGVDMAEGKGVDVVVVPGEPLPFADESFDVVVTSSAFEHDVCFWDTFLDLVRLLRPGGLLYINAPSNGPFHRWPLDCWRFYPDSGHALVEWARRRHVEVTLVESFVAAPRASGWCDFVMVCHKPGPVVERSGRMAELGETMNVFDVELPAIERESGPTYDMLEQASQRDAAAVSAAALLREQAETARLRAANERLRATNARVRKNNDRLRSTNARLRSRSVAARQRLDDVYASRSWKVTGVGRRAVKVLRRR